MFCESFFKDVGVTYTSGHPIRVYEGSKGLLPYFKTIVDDREKWTTTGSGFEDEDYDYARTASSV
jgi:hypothetical protein